MMPQAVRGEEIGNILEAILSGKIKRPEQFDRAIAEMAAGTAPKFDAEKWLSRLIDDVARHKLAITLPNRRKIRAAKIEGVSITFDDERERFNIGIRENDKLSAISVDCPLSALKLLNAVAIFATRARMA
jgi:hypothetical protein